MAIRRGKGQEPTEERWLEVDASMTGTLTFKDPVNLSINGRFEGTLDTKGSLAIGEQAQIKANITGEKIIVSGSILGNLTVTHLIEVRSTGRIQGKVITPRLIMHDGAAIHGTLEMLGERAGGQWMTVEELARYLEVDGATVAQWAKEGRLPGQQDGTTWRFERSRIEQWLAQERVK